MNRTIEEEVLAPPIIRYPSSAQRGEGRKLTERGTKMLLSIEWDVMYH
jgi:hypothetical protein